MNGLAFAFSSLLFNLARINLLHSLLEIRFMELFSSIIAL